MRALILTLLAGSLAASDWKPLFNGKNLDGWEVIGDGQWIVMSDGVLLGQRTGDLRKMPPPEFMRRKIPSAKTTGTRWTFHRGTTGSG